MITNDYTKTFHTNVLEGFFLPKDKRFMIEIKHISKTFQVKEQEFKALDDVSLHIPLGHIYGVIGVSGAGKSTLIRCVNLLERPDTGQVMIDGVDLTQLSNAKLVEERRKIGMIFQHFNLLSSRTVAQNIAFPLELGGIPKAEIQQRVTELLALVGLSDRSDAYPANLSGGQKQRVAIARALANKPSVLLCDEATSALDPGTTKSILTLLKDINEKLNLTILLITHEMEVIKSICTDVAVIHQGRLIENGPVEAIFTAPKTAIARGFIESSLNIELPLAYQSRLQAQYTSGDSAVMQLFLADDAHHFTFISSLNEQFQVDVDIISAQVDYVGKVNFGILYLLLKGEKDALDKAQAFFTQNYSKIDLLGYVR